jgi:hypothetical protein
MNEGDGRDKSLWKKKKFRDKCPVEQEIAGLRFNLPR